MIRLVLIKIQNNFRKLSQVFSQSFASGRLWRQGFTIIELLIFSALFSIMAISFMTALVSGVQMEAKQNATAEVTQQSQLLLDSVQYYVQSASLVEMTSDTATSTLKLRMASSTIDPTYISLSNNVVYIQQTDSGAMVPLTSSKVNVSNLTFTKHNNGSGHDSVSVVFTVAYNNSSPNNFLQSLNISVARVGAATFDSNMVPATTNTYKIGVSSQIWQSINDTVYFSGSNVGIGASSPGQTLEVNGGVRLNTSTSQPTCNSSQRGTFWVVESGAGIKDNVQVCAKDATETYGWRTIY